MATFVTGTAFITGAGAGIGQAAAFSLAQRGIDKLALADISLANLDQTVSELGQKHPGVELLPLHVDVASESSIEAAISKTVEVFGRIDIAVNNAGIAGPRGLSPDVSSNDWKRLMDVNLHGVWMCGKAEIREMLKQEPRGFREGRGSIINVASLYGIRGAWSDIPVTAYSAAKHAVVGLSKTEACSFATQGIRVNAICPGFVETPLLKAATSAGHMEKHINATPMGRLAKVEEIGDAIAFLGSPLSSFMTGAVMVVDGGYSTK